MAETTVTQAEAWNNSLRDHQSLSQRLAEAQAHEVDAIERKLAALEEDILDTSAPHLSGVLVKLHLLWQEQLTGLDPESEAKRLILEDFERLMSYIRDAAGPESHDVVLLAH